MFFFLQPVYSIVNGVVFIVILTTASNIVLSSLIAGRILYYERRVRKSLGVFNDLVYKKVVTICVESCALIVVVSVVFVILYYSNTHNAFLFPLVLLPHVCVSYPTTRLRCQICFEADCPCIFRWYRRCSLYPELHRDARRHRWISHRFRLQTSPVMIWENVPFHHCNSTPQILPLPVLVSCVASRVA